MPVGVSLAILDEQAAPGGERRRDEARAQLYGEWLDAVRGDDFLGVQNYEHRVWGAEGTIPKPTGVEKNMFGGEVYPASLAGAVRYAHQASGIPILVTEHGVCINDDSIRARMIPAALHELKNVIDEVSTCSWVRPLDFAGQFRVVAWLLAEVRPHLRGSHEFRTDVEAKRTRAGPDCPT